MKKVTHSPENNDQEQNTQSKRSASVTKIIDFIQSKFDDQIQRVENIAEREFNAIEKAQEDIKHEIKKIARQDYNLNAEFQSNAQAARELNIVLQDTQLLIQNSLTSQLDETRKVLEESMKLRQDIYQANSKVEEWQDLAVKFLDDMERTRESLVETNSSSVSEIDKVIEIFSRHISLLGIERITPKRRETFSVDFHHCKEEEEAEDVNPGDVLECKKWGYKLNGKPYKGKLAEVIVSKQIESNSEGSVNMSDRA